MVYDWRALITRPRFVTGRGSGGEATVIAVRYGAEPPDEEESATTRRVPRRASEASRRRRHREPRPATSAVAPRLRDGPLRVAYTTIFSGAEAGSDGV